MVESTIIITMVLLILVWLMSLGFMHYQRYLAVVAVNDAAVKIAASYNNPTADIIMGYTETEHLGKRDMYRRFTSGKLHDDNENRAEAYIRYRLDRMNFTGTVGDIDVTLDLINDSLLRRHVQVTAQCEFFTPLGIVMKLFGMDPTRTYTFTACADCTDPADYISTVSFAGALTSGKLFSGGEIIDSVIGFLGKLVSVYNKVAEG